MATTENKKDSLATKLARISQEIGAVAKDGVNDSVGGGYGFIRYDEISARIRNLYAREHILFLPGVTHWEDRPGVTSNNRLQHFIVLTFEMRLINGDDPTDYLTVPYIGASKDTSDKAVNKAVTAGVKSFLMRMHHVSDTAYEDPDKVTPEETLAKTAPTPPPPAQPPRQSTPPPPAQPPQRAELRSKFESEKAMGLWCKQFGFQSSKDMRLDDWIFLLDTWYQQANDKPPF